MRKHLKNHFIPHEGNDFKPHFVREKSVASIALIAIAIFALAYSVKSFVTRHPDLLSAVITSVLVDLTNSNRLASNLGTLEFNPTLTAAAQLKADDMAAKGYFAHNSPEGKTPWYWFGQAGYAFIYAGENLAVNFVDSEDVVRAWMDSEGHRANIMNDKFSEIGIAIASGKFDGRDSIYVVQLFGHPAPNLAPEPSVVREDTTSVPILVEETTASGPVASAESENLEVLSETDMFVAVENTAITESEEVPNEPTVAAAETAPESNTLDKALASPKMVLRTIYMLIGAVVLLSLILFIAYKPSKTHNKNVIYVILLLVLIASLLYLSSFKLFPEILIT